LIRADVGNSALVAAVEAAPLERLGEAGLQRARGAIRGACDRRRARLARRPAVRRRGRLSRRDGPDLRRLELTPVLRPQPRGLCLVTAAL